MDTMLLSHPITEVLRIDTVYCMLALPGDEQADFSHVHQCSPTLDRGCADVWDNTGQRRVLLRGQNYQHADGVAVIGQLNHLILQSLRGGGHTW